MRHGASRLRLPVNRMSAMGGPPALFLTGTACDTLGKLVGLPAEGSLRSHPGLGRILGRKGPQNRDIPNRDVVPVDRHALVPKAPEGT